MKVIVLTHRGQIHSAGAKPHGAGDGPFHGSHSIPSYCSGCGHKLSLLAGIHETTEEKKNEEPPPVYEPVHPDDSITVLPIDSEALELLVLVDKDLWHGKTEPVSFSTAIADDTHHGYVNGSGGHQAPLNSTPSS